MSPSVGAWAGRSASAKPSCAMIATRFICALSSGASVATMAIVVLAGSSRLSRMRERVAGACVGRAEAAELAAALVRRGPEMRAGAARRAPDRIDRDERADEKAARGDGARRAEAALEVAGRRAIAGAGRAQRELAARARRRREAELANRASAGPSPCRRRCGDRTATRPGAIGTRAAPTAKPRPCSAS